MRAHLSLIIILISVFSYSQDYNVNMLVSKSDLELNTYAKDTTANALVIYDYGNSFVDEKTFWLRFQFKQKIKILKSDGVGRGTFEIKLYKGETSEEKVIDIQGSTYNLENGEIQKTDLTPSAIYKEENENFTLVKFALPKVKAGSVITISYETQSRFMTKYQPWYFQGEDPVLYSEYNTSIPGNYEYHIKLVGELELHSSYDTLEKNCITTYNGGRGDCVVSQYVMKDIPAYKSESFTTTPLNYISRMEYELSVIHHLDGRVDKISKTWEVVDRELRNDEDFGRQVSRKSLVRKLLPEKITSITDQLQKAKAIYQYVLDNYKWNNKSERYDVSVKDLIKETVGSAFEINLLLENLLSSEGFKVYPILLSTRSNGFITKIYPVVTDFNYVILKISINNQDYFLDATDTYLPFGELPLRCLNQYGRILDFDNESGWQDIELKEHSLMQHRIKLQLSDTGFKGSLNSLSRGYHTTSFKRNYDENPILYKERKVNEYNNFRIDSHKVLDFDKNGKEFSEDLIIELDPEYIGNKIYFNPFIIKFFEENPFKLQERTYPIDFGYKDIYSYAMFLELPEDVKVLEIPPAIQYALPNTSGSFIFNVNYQNNQLILYFKVKFDKAIYGQEYYQSLKEFMNKVVEAQKNTILVLEKQ